MPDTSTVCSPAVVVSSHAPRKACAACRRATCAATARSSSSASSSSSPSSWYESRFDLMDYLLDVVIFFPLVGAVAVGFIPRERIEWLRLGALAVTVVTFLLSLGVLVNF